MNIRVAGLSSLGDAGSSKCNDSAVKSTLADHAIDLSERLG